MINQICVLWICILGGVLGNTPPQCGGSHYTAIGINPLDSSYYAPAFAIPYNNQTNPTGSCLLPDNVVVLEYPEIKMSTVDIISSNKQQFSGNKHVTVTGSLDVWKIGGSFSYDETKKTAASSSASHETIEIDVSLTTHQMTVALDNLKFTNAIKMRFDDIMNALNKNTIASLAKAKEMMNEIFNMYGVGAIYNWELGGRLTFITTIDKSKWSSYSDEEFKKNAKAHANWFFKASVSADISEGSSVNKDYENAITSTTLHALGGNLSSIEGDNKNINQWINSINDNPYLVHAYVMPICDTITPNRFLNNENSASLLLHLETSLIRELCYETLYKHISDNTYKGCTDKLSSNYDVNANYPLDEACKFEYSYSLGGYFVESSGSSNSACDSYIKYNELTGGFSCPENYTAVDWFDPFEISHSWTENKYICVQCFIIGRCCWWPVHTTEEETCKISPKVCMANDHIAQKQGVGSLGCFSDLVNNPLTNDKTCPKGAHHVSIPLGWNYAQYITCCYATFDMNPEILAMVVADGGKFSSQRGNIEIKNEAMACVPGTNRVSIRNYKNVDIYDCIKLPQSSGFDRKFCWPGCNDVPTESHEFILLENNTYFTTLITSKSSYDAQHAQVKQDAFENGYTFSFELGRDVPVYNEDNITISAESADINNNDIGSTKLGSGEIIAIVFAISIVVVGSMCYVIYHIRKKRSRYNTISTP